MKRLLLIILFFCTVTGLMASFEKSHPDCYYWNFEWFIKADTSLNKQFLIIDSFDLKILPPSSGVQFYKDGIVFLSLLKDEVKRLPGHISFGAIEAYYAIVEDSILGNHFAFSHSSSFSYPCEAITFSSDYNTMYFTKLSKTDGREKIYQAIYSSQSDGQEGWTSNIKPMDFCNDNSIYTHPALSADGKILIFASNKPGSVGGMDLFITRKEGESWSAPENLGKDINTKANELYPYLDSDNNLFFSSDGLKGFGGYDIFVCKYEGKSWYKPVNLSNYINTVNDDIAFTVSRKDGKSAFFTIREKSIIYKMQLYRISPNPWFEYKDSLNLSDILTSIILKDKILPEKITAFITEPVKTITPKTEPEIEVIKKEPEIQVQQTIIQPEVKKEEVKVAEKTVIEPEPKVKPPEAKVVTIKPTIPTPAEQKDVVIYRVQFLSGTKPLRNNKIIVNGKSYNTYEYFYLEAYRYTIGEFTTLTPAIELQKTCRQSGYPQAFVAAFKNNTRSLDLKLFK